MDSVKQLQRQYVQFVKSLYREKTIDRQFIEILKLESNDPQILSDAATTFFNMWERISQKIDVAIEQRNVEREVYEAVHRLKGASMSTGAKKVTALCLAFQDHFNTQNHEGCLQCLPQIKEEYYAIKDKMQTVFSLQEQIRSAGGTIPIMG